MKRFLAGMMPVAVAAAVFAVPAPSAAASCAGQGSNQLFSYDCDHVRLSDLPLRFRLNLSGRPAGVSDNDVRSAVRAAAFEWDRHWPSTGINPGRITASASPGDCGYWSARAICYDGATSATFRADVGDGINSIVFADPQLCPGGSATAVATACLRYKGSSATGRRIAEVDIILNPAKDWRWPSGAAEIAVGESNSFYPDCGMLPTCVGAWYDIQSVLTHELGHALGLEHVGSVGFPARLAEFVESQQTMYFRSYYRSTGPRTLHAGDIAGLQVAALNSHQDP